MVILRLSVNLIRILSLPLPIRRKRETIIFHTFFVWEPANKPFLLPPPPLVILNLLTVCCTSKMLFQRKTYHGKQNLHNVTSGREKNKYPPSPQVSLLKSRATRWLIYVILATALSVQREKESIKSHKLTMSSFSSYTHKIIRQLDVQAAKISKNSTRS